MNSNRGQRKIRAGQTRANSALWPAVVAMGGSLGALPAGALELGDLSVESTLGQPLRASIAYALAPNETLADYCVSLRPGGATDGLPSLTRADIRIVDGRIVLTSRSVVQEPLLTARLNVNCPYTPKITREYMLFVDPPGQQSQISYAAESPAAPRTEPVAAQPVARRTRAATPSAAAEPVDEGTRYRVQPGDTLSEIAQRIENRTVGLWPAVNAIFAANPSAFIDDDPNRLKAGSWLVIPNLSGTSEPVRFAQEAATAPAAEAGSQSAISETAAGSAYSGDDLQQPAASTASVDAAAESGPDAESPDAADAGATAATDSGRAVEGQESAVPGVTDDGLTGKVTTADVAATNSSDLMPGDVVLSENPFVDGAESGSGSAVSVRTAEAEAPAAWPWWLGGGVLTLLAGLWFFGRRTQDDIEPLPTDETAPHPMRRSTDDPTNTIETLRAGDSYELEDDSPTEENLTLDADLFEGTGLSAGTDVDVKEEFVFAATTNLDYELPEGSDEELESVETDMIPPPDRSTIESILESEVLPDDDDYDMSVIVDATKMPVPEDVTERDLKAVEVGSHDTDEDDGSYTVSQEIDYEILERDYEDELTATQALNKEIEKAAAELAERLGDEDESTGDTTEMQLASVTELDVTANLNAGNDDASDLEDTGINEAITANIKAEDKTVEMPQADDDATSEMATRDETTTEIEVASGTHKT